MCAHLTRERASLLLEVAHLYWDEDLDQATIASKMGYSRPTVSRMLSEARRHGVVTVTVSHPIERLMALEERLTQTFGLKEARVAEDRADGANGPGAEVAQVCGDLLLEHCGPRSPQRHRRVQRPGRGRRRPSPARARLARVDGGGDAGLGRGVLPSRGRPGHLS